MMTDKERFELFWSGDPKELSAGFETMRRNVLMSGKVMTVDQVLQFLSSFWRAIGPQPRQRPQSSYHRMLI
ncbi:MAG: hypothetical protein HZB91_09995 [Elusimicrobia bacterium]|nr:hypothetical protein [Elusimicrobiota bacterium]